jgi:hypothetical protein
MKEKVNRNQSNGMAILSESIYVAPKKRSSWLRQQVEQPGFLLSVILLHNTILIDGMKGLPGDTGYLD